MGRIKGHYEWDDDGLTPGQKSEGGLHQNLFDRDGNLKGNARFIPDEENDPDPLIVTETVYVPTEQRRRSPEQEQLEQTISDLITVGISYGIAMAKPYVERWWREKARPAVDGQRVKWSGRRLRRRRGKETSAVESTALDQSQELAEMAARGRRQMSSAEAQARYLAALAARAYSDEQMRLVSGADIVDGEDLAELKRSVAGLPSDQVKYLVESMATDPSLLGEDTLAELASILGRRDRSGNDESRRLA